MAILSDLRTKRFWSRFALHGFSAAGALAAAVGLFDVVFPNLVFKAGGTVVVLIAVVSLLYGLIVAWPRPIQRTYSSPNVTIRLLEGDLFRQPGHLVIGMADTFDTQVPKVIARSSVQAQFLDRIYDSNSEKLDAALEIALANKQVVGVVEKVGKTNRYAVGTVAVLEDLSRRYFCVAYTCMNEKNEARASVDGVWRSLENLWKAISEHGNGGTVSIAIIGGGQSRLSHVLPTQHALRLMVLSFIIASKNIGKFCDELVIVSPKAQYENLDRLEIQAFLDSLRAS